MATQITQMYMQPILTCGQIVLGKTLICIILRFAIHTTGFQYIQPLLVETKRQSHHQHIVIRLEHLKTHRNFYVNILKLPCWYDRNYLPISICTWRQTTSNVIKFLDDQMISNQKSGSQSNEHLIDLLTKSINQAYCIFSV